MNRKPDPRVRFEPELAGQKALVTGASSGIGRAIALALGEAGADVVVNYVSDEDKARAIVEEIRAKGVHAMALRADVSDEGQVREMFWQMIDEFGTIDLLVNSAGLQQLLCSREAVREFMRRGVKQDVSCSAGKIICIGSIHEDGVMLSLAQEVAAYRIRVNSIYPGEPEEIGRATVWLASDYADYVHGVSLFVAAGAQTHSGNATRVALNTGG